ncbi:hypothetical protein KSP39_PZI006301 [Platanthera zijinensis]|uniref:Knottins-like domain-containing protein n=1 Tax=Platanthera zijinensis TaxID=2320716 RepID=A0AAP0BS54_9ASPA
MRGGALVKRRSKQLYNKQASMEFNKRNLPTLVLVLLLLVSSDVRAEAVVQDGRVCFMKSSTFAGLCVDSDICWEACRGESNLAIGGFCNGELKCICSYACR